MRGKTDGKTMAGNGLWLFKDFFPLELKKEEFSSPLKVDSVVYW
jgi:hypothetical protein